MSAAHQPFQVINTRPRHLLVRAGALYDLLAIGPLALPGIASMHLELMFWANNKLGFAGNMPTFEPVEMLFVNLFGLFAIMWITLRLFKYEPRFLAIDLIFRSLVSLLLFYYALTQDVHKLIWIFLLVELFFVGGYLILISKNRRLASLT